MTTTRAKTIGSLIVVVLVAQSLPSPASSR